MRYTNAIEKFISELPPEFAALKPRAEKLLDAHREDVIAAFKAGDNGLTDPLQLQIDAEYYYEERHTK
jgi:hypothetical protein